MHKLHRNTCLIYEKRALHMSLWLGSPQVSGEQFFADVARDVLLYVSRDLSDKVSHLPPH